MDTEKKEELIVIRIQKEKKDRWKKLCKKRKISMTSLLVDSVEERVLNDERRKIITFIEKQDNVFIKIETNINQVARIVNAQKFISKNELEKFCQQLEEIKNLKKKQNEMFKKIYQMLSK